MHVVTKNELWVTKRKRNGFLGNKIPLCLMEKRGGEDRRRLGKENKSSILFCFSLALHYFAKRRRQAAARKRKQIFDFVLLFTRLALLCQKAKIGGGSEKKTKTAFLFCFSLALHYLCKKK